MKSESTKVIQKGLISYYLKLLKNVSFNYKGTLEEEIDITEIFYEFKYKIEDFPKLIEFEYLAFISEFEIVLTDTFSKYDKLFLISRILVEIESCRIHLTKNTKGIFTHENFKLLNIYVEEIPNSRDIEKIYFQVYYRSLNHYIDKTLSFLTHLKEVTINTNQNEFALPTSMVSKPNESTKEKPLEYFEYIFCRDGFPQLKKSFSPTLNDLVLYGAKHDIENETITHHIKNPETGYFKDPQPPKHISTFFSEKLKVENSKSCNLIYDHIYELEDDAEIRLFLKLIISKIDYILNAIDSKDEFKKYPEISNEVLSIVEYIIEKHTQYVNSKSFSPYLKEIIDKKYPDLEIPDSKLDGEMQTPMITKIDTNLTVDELGYLFKCLMDLNYFKQPKPKPGTSFHKTVASIFKCNGSDFVEGSFNNSFNKVNPNAVDAWKKRFIDLKQKAQNEFALNKK
jgi:hypothetical protein